MQLRKVVDEIDVLLPNPPQAGNGGSLLVMVGLPASGKSSIVNNLRPLVPFVLISTDWIRTQIQNRPTYTASEMAFVYEIGYRLVEKRLCRGQRVVFDASNYLAARREHLSKLAAQCGAPTAVCLVQAAQEMVEERLLQRMSSQRREGDLSDADWTVYKWMVEAQEPVVGPHVILDTTHTEPQPLAQKLYAYWLEIEVNAANNTGLQSPGWLHKLNGYD